MVRRNEKRFILFVVFNSLCYEEISFSSLNSGFN